MWQNHRKNIAAMCALFGLLGSAWADAGDAALSTGQTLYLPIYSHIWHGDRVAQGKYPLKNQMSALVSIRNTNSKTPIKIVSARYYSTEGTVLKSYVPTPQVVAPMGTYELFVENQDNGGSGANFIIQWESATPANAPVVEAVHANIKGHTTLAFITTARVIDGSK